MKRKISVLFLLVALVLCATLVFAACQPKNDETVLNIVCLNKGYGRNWIDELVRKFEADHPGYKVNLEATASARSLITSHISSKNNVDDLYISVGADWMTYAAQGKLASLDDIMDDQVDGMTLQQKVNAEYQNSVKYPDKDGTLHTYRLPWISATGGIFYNAKMFEKYGWEVPTTYDELVALCQQIVAGPTGNGSGYLVSGEDGAKRETIKPFVYTSDNPDYFDYTVYTWWAQLAGKQNINTFMNYEAASNYSQSSPTYQKLKEATNLWYNLFDADKKFALQRGSNDDAQRAFCNGQAAMMFNGDWMYNEVLNLKTANEDFQLAIMKTPTVNNAASDGDLLYTIGEDQYIAIPASSIKKDLAKDFIKLMVSDYGCKTFLTKANGMLAYKCNYSEQDTSNAFLKNLVEVRNSYSDGTFTNYPSMEGQVAGTSKMLYLTSQIDIWGTSALRPYSNLISKQQTLDDAFTTISSQMSQQWTTMLNKAGIR